LVEAVEETLGLVTGFVTVIYLGAVAAPAFLDCATAGFFGCTFDSSFLTVVALDSSFYAGFP
jgi:hypothetical protein